MSSSWAMSAAMSAPLSSALGRTGASAAPVYEPDAADFFARAETLGGSSAFDLTAINAAYTASYCKTAWDAFYRGLKADGLWSLIVEIYPLCGVVFGALPAKGKYVSAPSSTLVGFVTGDYVAAGAAPGLKGGTTSKYMTHGIKGQDISAASVGHLAAVTVPATASGYYLSTGVNSSDVISLARSSAGSMDTWISGGFSGVGITQTATKGVFVGSTLSGNRTLYKDGTSVATSAAAFTAHALNEEYVGFVIRATAGSNTFASPATSRNAMHIATAGLTGAQAAALTARVSALLTAFGYV